MIRGCHTMFYSSKPVELRAFLRDKLKFSFTDVGDGWLIFNLPEADMGVHTKIGTDDTDNATPLVVRFGNWPDPLTLSHTSVFPVPAAPLTVTLAAVTLKGMISPLEPTSS